MSVKVVLRSPVQAELIECLLRFNAGDYDGCLYSLDKLRSSRELSLQVQDVLDAIIDLVKLTSVYSTGLYSKMYEQLYEDVQFRISEKLHTLEAQGLAAEAKTLKHLLEHLLEQLPGKKQAFIYWERLEVMVD